MFKGRYSDSALAKKEEPKDYKDLAAQEPQVVSITFHRSSRPGAVHQRLGFRLHKGGEDGGDIRIAELDGKEDSILQPFLPIQVGDMLVAVNHQSCYGIEFDVLLKAIATTTGLITLHFRRTSAAPLQDEIKQAIFYRAREHTCLPMAIDFKKPPEEGLTINDMDDQNPWLLSSCLEKGQVVLTMNGARSYQLEEEDAQLFLQTQSTLAKYLSLKTYFPSRKEEVGSQVEAQRKFGAAFGAWGRNLPNRLRRSGSRDSANLSEDGQDDTGDNKKSVSPPPDYQRYKSSAANGKEAADKWRNRSLEDEI